MMLASVEHSEFTLQDLVSAKRETVTVCIPTRETASTIEATLGAMAGLRDEGLVDQLLVVDADSADGTAELAREAGAEVFSESELMPEFGPVAGKGDAMWRGLSVAGGDIVLYLDGDIRDFGPHYAIGLLGPLLRPDLLPGAEGRSFDFVKGFYRRPFSLGDSETQEGGGRVTELTAKPLLELLVPELGAFSQPLAGECAARRSLLAGIPYCTRYGVEIAMLVEVWKRVGIARMAQVGLGTKRNSHQSLAELGKMSRQVVEALVAQTQWEEPGIVATGSPIAPAAEGLDLEVPESESSSQVPRPHKSLDLGAVRPAAGWQSRLELRPPMASLAPREGRPALSPSEAIPR